MFLGANVRWRPAAHATSSSSAEAAWRSARSPSGRSCAPSLPFPGEAATCRHPSPIGSTTDVQLALNGGIAVPLPVSSRIEIVPAFTIRWVSRSANGPAPILASAATRTSSAPPCGPSTEASARAARLTAPAGHGRCRMDYVKLGRTGTDVSRLCLGCMTFGVPDRGTHPWTLDEEKSRPIMRRAVELGINFFDTANSYSDGTSEEITGRLLREFDASRRDRRRHQGVLPDPARPERPRPGAQGHLPGDRRQPAPARHGLRRPLPDPSLGRPHADRGDARGAARRGQGRQGALHRRVVDVRVAVRDGAAGGDAARLDALRHDAEPRQPALPRGGARDAAAVPRRRDRRAAVEPAGPRPADARLARDDVPRRDRRGRQALVRGVSPRPIAR